MPQVRKAAVAGVAKKTILFSLFFLNLYTIDFAQILPPNETQVNFSGYFDDFNVSVLYPSIALTKRVSESTSITGRYLVDMITAASIRNHSPAATTTTNNSLQKVDAVTAASGRSSGGGGGGGNSAPAFDEVRHEFNLGFAHVLGQRNINR